VLNSIMTLTSHNEVGPYLQASPAVVFSSQLLHEGKSSFTVNSSFMEEKFTRIDVRAKLMTPTLEHIEGWDHGGLND